jgi:hypothetical protein
MPRCRALPLDDTTVMNGTRIRIAPASLLAAVLIPILLSCSVCAGSKCVGVMWKKNVYGWR